MDKYLFSEILSLGSGSPLSYECKDKLPHINLSNAGQVALMVYTSGSTGNPKGVLNSHSGLRALCEWIPDFIGYESKGVIGEYASFSFVQSCNDLYPPLTVGATVYIIPTSLQQDLSALNTFITSNGIEYLRVTTQVGTALMNSFDLSLKKLVLGGEKVQFISHGKTRIISSYGCSETCGSVANAEVSMYTANSKSVLGSPMPGVEPSSTPSRRQANWHPGRQPRRD